MIIPDFYLIFVKKRAKITLNIVKRNKNGTSKEKNCDQNCEKDHCKEEHFLQEFQILWQEQNPLREIPERTEVQYVLRHLNDGSRRHSALRRYVYDGCLSIPPNNKTVAI